MSAISFLNNLQIGSKIKSKSTVNFDNVISRLVCHKKDIFTVQGEEIEVPPFSCKFRRDAQSDLLAVCTEDGDILLYDTLRKEDPLIKTFSAHHNAIFDICWVPDKCHLISGSGDHLAILWDISSCKCISVFRQHIASIKSVDVCHEQSAVFATGSRDGNINVWDTRERLTSGSVKPVISIFQAHNRKNTVLKGNKNAQKESVSSVSSVAFQDSINLASAGVADGIVKIWDLRKTYVLNSKFLPSPKYRMEYSECGTGHGCTSIVFDSRYTTLYACTTNNKILKFNCHSYVKEAAVYEGFQCSTYFVKLDLSSNDQYLLCGSSDEKAYIWKTSKPGLPIVQLASHSAEVTSVNWCPYGITKLATCGDDSKVTVWRVSDTEDLSVNENIHAIAESYHENILSPKNGSCSLFQNTAQNSIITSNRASTAKKPSVESNRTPYKPALRAITNFFSPLTPFIKSLTKCDQNEIDSDENNSSNSSSKSINKTLVEKSPSAVLTPCNSVNINNSNHHSVIVNSAAQTSSPEVISSPEQKNIASSSFNISTSNQNKENMNMNVSPEPTLKTKSTSQAKRKVTSKHSIPILKRKRTESSKKTKGTVKDGKKTVNGKTIMNYFSVVLCNDKNE